MFIKSTACISPQETFPNGFTDGKLQVHQGTRYYAREPDYTGMIPAALLRRMGKAVRMGVGAGLQLLREEMQVDGLLVGTANGGLEDCIKFLNQIVDYREGTLTPTNFVQSTPNAIAGQLALLARNTGYNITHVHKGHAFENALLDAMMLFRENRARVLLVGGIEEISESNYTIDTLLGTFRTGETSSETLLLDNAPGTVNGEGAVQFLLSQQPMPGKQVRILDVAQMTYPDSALVQRRLTSLLQLHGLGRNELDGLILGYNGDNRTDHWYSKFLEPFPPSTPVFTFKNATGEYPTAVSFAVWLGHELLSGKTVPEALIRVPGETSQMRTLLIYNHFGGIQHSLILLQLHHEGSGTALKS